MRGGMPNMQQMMKQAQKLQKQMTEAQDGIKSMEFVGKSANDYVVATFSGERVLKDLAIQEEIVDVEDMDMLTDMILDAVNDGLKQIEATTEKTMGQYTKGLPF